MDENQQTAKSEFDIIGEIIDKGEKVKVLYELLMEKLEMTYENTLRDVMGAIKGSMTEYYDAVEKLNGVNEKGKKLTKKT